MAIVAGFDVHRRQITFDALDTETGEVSRGRIDDPVQGRAGRTTGTGRRADARMSSGSAPIGCLAGLKEGIVPV